MRLGKRSFVIALALVAGTTVPSAQAEPVPPAPSGWTTVFTDDFAGPAGSAPSAANWFYDIGTGYGTGEKEHTTNSTDNVYLDGAGHLVLKAIRNGSAWTSGRIESTRDDFQAPPGGKLEMTASIKQPDPSNGLGYWPAFWTLGAPMRSGGGWPQSGEIDMMEDVNGLDAASQTLHDAAGSTGHPLVSCPGAGSTCQTGYHTYSVVIDRTDTTAELLQFLMDGVVEKTVTEAAVGKAAWAQAVDHGFYLIWDLAIGGNYPDGKQGSATPTSATTSGGFLSADYVAVYEQGGDSTPTARPVATGTVKGIGGLCLANQNSLNTKANPIVVADCAGSAGQQWFTYSDSTLRVQGGCLGVVGAGTTTGTDTDWYPCNGTPSQRWTRQADGELLSPGSGLCLTDPGADTGARLDIETCTGSPQQQWTGPGGTSGGCGTTNVALRQPATSSSQQSDTYSPAKAVDGDPATRWSSESADPQWLTVDLGSVRSLCQAVLSWQHSYAKSFQLQLSTDGQDWKTIFSTTAGAGGVQQIIVTGTGRYLRVYGTVRATQYGYSLYELQAFAN